MRRRRERNLTSDEISLWTHVARTVKPFAGSATKRQKPVVESMVSLLADMTSDLVPEKTVTDDGTHVQLAVKGSRSGSGSPSRLSGSEPLTGKLPSLAPLVPLERRVLTALRRGQHPLEAVIDLHGLRQSDAHDRLRSFLVSEQSRGSRLVLVITGKGGAGTSAGGEERGVLKRTVPHWLRMADLRATVLGFEDAALNHGGSGALYVRLRRLKETVPR